MTAPAPLAPAALYIACDPAALDFASTADLPDLETAQIHGRAMEAMQLGLKMPHAGYNLFVLGETGSGRHAIAQQLLETERQDGTPPSDWCYVYNFAEATRPDLLRLPCGRGARLRDDMQQFVEALTPAINTVFQSDAYRARIEALQEETKQREAAALKTLGEEASRVSVGLVRTPSGFVFVPMKDDESAYAEEEFDKLPQEQQQALATAIKDMYERLHKLMSEFPRWHQEMLNRMKQAGSDALRTTVTHMVEDLKPAYADLPEVTAYLDAVLADIVESGESLRASTHSEGDTETTTYSGAIALQRYLVNLLVENPADGARPVVYEVHPTLQNLLGRIENMVHMGTLVSNFTLIRGGALHSANGGFLMLDALKVLQQPYAWEGLKRCLKAGSVRIESLSDLIGLTSTVQLEPEPVPLDLKIVLIGERLVYYLLSQYDPDFPALFKINADMESEIERSPANTRVYAQLIATLARRAQLRPLSATAVARVIEHAARLANDAERLTTRTQPIDNLLREADHFAAQAGADQIGRNHVDQALAAHRQRNESIRKRYQEEILRGQLLIDTTGAHVGQINGLAVIPLGESSFAHPVRITATVRMGEGEVIDIEREVELGGPIHSKGVLILSSFLAARFGWAVPLSLKASLVFEQSYGGVEGDSASLAELAALLSALSDFPIRQSLAVTGSVNQFGVVQPVGGINEKIEGFFDICAARGLTGDEGVLIPAANICHLMLRPEVVAAVKEGKFAIRPVRNIDEAMELLTGMPAGEPDAKGELPAGTVNYQIAVQLAGLAQMRQSFARPPRKRRAGKKKSPAAPPAKQPVAQNKRRR
jgi:lon-related putative ATP-dependent protease